MILHLERAIQDPFLFFAILSFPIIGRKEECKMITLAILGAILLGVIVIGIALLLAGGISILLTFGDVIVAGLIIYAIIKHVWKRHHKN